MGKTLRRGVRSGVCALAAAMSFGAAGSVAAQTQTEAETGVNSTLSPEALALVAEIDSFSAKDQSRDPAGDLVLLADLEKRVAANGELPPLELGLLASAKGAAHFYLREYDKAADQYGIAAAFFEEGNAPPEEMSGLYNNQASILASVGRYEEAESAHRKALAIRQSMEGERGPKVASSLFGLGFVYYRQGRVEESLDYFRKSIDQQVEFVGPEDPQTIMRVTSLASVLGRSGREDEALQVARRAEALGRKHLGNDHPTHAIVLNNLGNALIENGLFAEAIPLLRETLAVRQNTIGENATGTALSLRNLATALKQTGNIEEAETLNLRAIEIYEDTGEVETPFALAYMYADIATIAADRNDWDRYDLYMAKALSDAANKLGDDNHDRANINLYHAERLQQRGDLSAALALAERWVPVMQAALIESHKDRIWAELLLASLRQASGRADYWPVADLAVGRLQAKLADLSITDRRLVREAETHREAALIYLEMAANEDDSSRIFTAVQLAGISDLSLGQKFADDSDTAEDAVVLQRRALLDLARQREETRTRLSSAVEAGDSGVIEQLNVQLDTQVQAFTQAEEQFAKRFPDYQLRYRPQPVSLSEIRDNLEENERLVLSVAGAKSNWVILITDRAFTARQIDSRLLATEVASIRQSLEQPGDYSNFPFETAHSLYGKIFDGLEISEGSHLYFHGGGPLASIPFSMLLTDAHSGNLANAPWLVKRASSEVIGNLALFVREGQRATIGSVRKLAGIGGSDLPTVSGTGLSSATSAIFRSGRPAMQSIADLPQLPNAEKELRDIAQALDGGDSLILVGPDAREENFKSTDLSDADVITFATHGLVAGELRDLWEPALLLGTGSPDSGEDGLLGASEIARLDINAEWVILSACNTSSGQTQNGPVYSGLATAFAQAGARSLMLSHWRVRDDAAARLSVGTIANTLTGNSRAEALRKAQMELIADRASGEFSHPALWAPFVIVEL